MSQRFPISGSALGTSYNYTHINPERKTGEFDPNCTQDPHELDDLPLFVMKFETSTQCLRRRSQLLPVEVNKFLRPLRISEAWPCGFFALSSLYQIAQVGLSCGEVSMHW